jgi:hypothetical protein
MIHHDDRDYETAASEAAQAGRVKMEEIIHRGQERAAEVIRQIEDTIITDRIVRAPAMRFRAEPLVPEVVEGPATAEAVNRARVVLDVEDGRSLRLHEHALRGAASWTGIPHAGQFIRLMESHGADGLDLLATNLNRLMAHQTARRYLVRAVTDEARGIVSDKYRRIDSRLMVEAFASAAQDVGLVPVEGWALDTKVRIRAVLPRVFEPVPNEVILPGLQWGTSDFGDGGHTVSVFFMRVWCTNTAIRDEVLRQVHLGARLPDNVEMSTETVRLDNAANASALGDVVRAALGPAPVNQMMEDIRAAHAAKLDPDKAVELLRRKLSKELTEEVASAFRSPDVEMLPPGNTRYRLSNAVSWVAQRKPADERMALDRLAGELVPSSLKTEAVTV